MAELTNRVEADLVLDKKMAEGRFGGGDLHDYVASQELTVTITLSEYRELISGIATKNKDLDIANENKYQREQEIKDVKATNDALKAENYDLKTQIDALKEQIENQEIKEKELVERSIETKDRLTKMTSRARELEKALRTVKVEIRTEDAEIRTDEDRPHNNPFE